jgi:hypothetical protein
MDPDARRAAPLPADLPTLGRLAVRAVVLDFLIRAALAAALMFGDIGIDPLEIVRPSPPFAPESLAVACVAGGLLCLDVKVTREALFLAHLGIGLRHAFAVGVAAAATAEAAASLLVRAVAALVR